MILRDLTHADAPATPADLRPPRHRVSPRAIRYWTARAAARWAVIVVAQAAWLLAAPADRRWHVLGLAVTAIVAATHLAVMPRWRYAVHRWEAAPGARGRPSGNR